LICFVPSLLSCNEKCATVTQTKLDESAPDYRSCPFSSFPVVSSTSSQFICCSFEAIKQR